MITILTKVKGLEVSVKYDELKDQFHWNYSSNLAQLSKEDLEEKAHAIRKVYGNLSINKERYSK